MLTLYTILLAPILFGITSVVIFFIGTTLLIVLSDIVYYIKVLLIKIKFIKIN